MSTKKVAIVTGAGSGIGAATAKRFARDGYAVVLNGRTESKLQAVRDQIDDADTVISVGDVSEPASVDKVVSDTVAAFGKIDVLVNNAAIAVFQPIADLALEDWNRQLQINVTGPFLMTKAALPHLETSSGAVVNVSSVSGLGGDWGGFAYNTTKGALNLMTKGLALDLAPKGVRINAVAPSLVATEMSSFVREDDGVMQKFRDRLPMKRAAEAAEVADVIAFLASADARFVNGAILTVDGGLNASNGQPNMTA